MRAAAITYCACFLSEKFETVVELIIHAIDTLYKPIFLFLWGFGVLGFWGFGTDLYATQ